jgi:hypothetical protein
MSANYPKEQIDRVPQMLSPKILLDVARAGGIPKPFPFFRALQRSIQENQSVGSTFPLVLAEIGATFLIPVPIYPYSGAIRAARHCGRRRLPGGSHCDDARVLQGRGNRCHHRFTVKLPSASAARAIRRSFSLDFRAPLLSPARFVFRLLFFFFLPLHALLHSIVVFRSKKCDELRDKSMAEVLWYFSVTNTQYRIRCYVEEVGDDGSSTAGAASPCSTSAAGTDAASVSSSSSTSSSSSSSSSASSSAPSAGVPEEGKNSSAISEKQLFRRKVWASLPRMSLLALARIWASLPRLFVSMPPLPAFNSFYLLFFAAPTRAMFDWETPGTPLAQPDLRARRADPDKYNPQVQSPDIVSPYFSLLLLHPVACDQLIIPTQLQDTSKVLLAGPARCLALAYVAG